MNPGAASGLWAVHIADGLLQPSWWLGGYGLAGVLAWSGSRRIRDEEIARIAVLTAAFFVASLIHLPLGPTSVHLLLNGLVGVVLGWRAALAIPCGLFLQAVLLQHGGLTALGVNSCVQVIPAGLAGTAFAALHRLPWSGQAWFRAAVVTLATVPWFLCLVYAVGLLLYRDDSAALRWTMQPLVLLVAFVLSGTAAWVIRGFEKASEFALGLLIGQTTVLLTLVLNALVLVWGGQESWQSLVVILFLAHLPVVFVEGLAVGFTVSFLARVKPEMLGTGMDTLPKSC